MQATPSLALMLLAILLLDGCGSHSDGSDAASSNGSGPNTYDGSGSVGLDGSPDVKRGDTRTSDSGVRLDGAATSEARQMDARTSADTTVPIDATAAPDAVNRLEVASGDAKPVIEVLPADARRDTVDMAALDVASDAAPTLDLATTEPCTETKKFDGTAEVTTDRTLTKGCAPYAITKSIKISGNATLTIEPGVLLNMSMDTAIVVGSSSAGRLVAEGTADAPIVFTSPTEGPGDWIGIQFWGNTATGSRISHATLDYCGQSSFACIHGEGGVKGGRLTIDHVTIDHVGDNANAITQRDTDSSFAISNCSFKNLSPVQYALSVDGASFAGVDGTNTFDGTTIELRGGDINATTTWQNPHTPIVVSGDIYVDGDPAPTLTMAAGMQLQFLAGTGIHVGFSKGGVLELIGTAAAPITLTSANPLSNPGDWTGIILWYSSSATISHATIAYAGSTSASSSNGAVSVVSDDDSLDIRSSTISCSAGYAVGIPCGSQATIVNTDNDFTTENALGPVGPGPDVTSADCQ